MSGAAAALTPTGYEASAARFAAISRYAITLPVTHTTVWNFGQTTLLITSPSSSAQTRGLAGGLDCRHREMRPVRRRTYSVPEVAVILGIGRSTAYALVQRGELAGLRVGGRVVVACAEIDRMLGEDPAA